MSKPVRAGSKPVCMCNYNIYVYIYIYIYIYMYSRCNIYIYIYTHIYNYYNIYLSLSLYIYIYIMVIITLVSVLWHIFVNISCEEILNSEVPISLCSWYESVALLSTEKAMLPVAPADLPRPHHCQLLSTAAVQATARGNLLPQVAIPAHGAGG